MLTVDKRNELQHERDIQDILSSEQGRRFLWHLLSYCGIYRDVEGEQIDMYKQLGKRQVGLYLMAVLSDVDDEQVFTMMREAKNKDIKDEYDRRIEIAAADRIAEDDGGASHTYRSSDSLGDYI